METKRTFAQHVAHMKSAREWKVGDRVRVTMAGKTGTIVAPHQRHNGFMVEWDEPVFGVTRGRVSASQMERMG